MPTGRDYPERLDELSAEETRRYLLRFLGRQDLDEHADIYEELATEQQPAVVRRSLIRCPNSNQQS